MYVDGLSDKQGRKNTWNPRCVRNVVVDKGLYFHVDTSILNSWQSPRALHACSCSLTTLVYMEVCPQPLWGWALVRCGENELQQVREGPSGKQMQEEGFGGFLCWAKKWRGPHFPNALQQHRSDKCSDSSLEGWLCLVICAFFFLSRSKKDLTWDTLSLVLIRVRTEYNLWWDCQAQAGQIFSHNIDLFIFFSSEGSRSIFVSNAVFMYDYSLSSCMSVSILMGSWHSSHMV